MPYFITDKADGCSGWATIKSDGEIVGCHTTKSAAIKQMVAISLAEKMQPGGKRNDSGPQAVIVDIDGILIINGQRVEKTYNFLEAMDNTEIIIVTGRPASTRRETMDELDTLDIDYDQLLMNPGSTAQSPEFKKSTAEKLLKTYNVILAIDDNAKNRANYRQLGITALDLANVPETPKQNNDESDHMDDDNLDNYQSRAINAKVPAYMRAAARRGLEYVADGKAGDGLKQQTINEARKMASGEISDDKWIRMAAWIARHLGDLDSPEADPQHPNYPSPGVVAHLLWGSGPSKTKARAAMQYAEGVVERIRNEQKRHLPGGHDQKSHGGGGGMNVLAGLKANKRKYSKKKRNVTLPDENFAAEVVGLDRVELVSAAMDKYGYNDKPSVSDEEFNELKNAGATVVYRGVEPKGNMTADEITVDFREGDKHFVGGGHYGQGTYTTSSKEEAKLYTGGDNNGAMMAMAIRPEAKIIDYADIEGEAFRLLNSQNDPNLQYSDGFTFLERDESATAMHLGYDVIKRQSTANETHYIILNRSAVVLPQSNEAYDE